VGNGKKFHHCSHRQPIREARLLILRSKTMEERGVSKQTLKDNFILNIVGFRGSWCCEVSERATHRSSPHGLCEPSA
jgi:hypothetical protein